MTIFKGEFDPYHQQFEPIEDEEAVEIAIDALVKGLNIPEKSDAWGGGE